jgi:hypothetical protein
MAKQQELVPNDKLKEQHAELEKLVDKLGEFLFNNPLPQPSSISTGLTPEQKNLLNLNESYSKLKTDLDEVNTTVYKNHSRAHQCTKEFQKILALKSLNTVPENVNPSEDKAQYQYLKLVTEYITKTKNSQKNTDLLKKLKSFYSSGMFSKADPNKYFTDSNPKQKKELFNKIDKDKDIKNMLIEQGIDYEKIQRLMTGSEQEQMITNLAKSAYIFNVICYLDASDDNEHESLKNLIREKMSEIRGKRIDPEAKLENEIEQFHYTMMLQLYESVNSAGDLNFTSPIAPGIKTVEEITQDINRMLKSKGTVQDENAFYTKVINSYQSTQSKFKQGN